MPYPTRVRMLPCRTLVATRWLVLSGALVAGSLLACSEDAGTTDDSTGTPTSGTQTSTTAAVTSATTGNTTTSTTGGTSGGTLGMSSASLTTTGTTTTGGMSSSSSGGPGSTTGTTGGEGGTGGTSSSSSTTTGSGAGGTGGTGSTGFQPCPETGPCKVLPLGDSITVGLGYDGGYRVELFHLALEGGHEITFTGTQQPNGPSMVDGVTFPRNHEGISGQFIHEIGNRVPAPAFNDDMPNIILVHAGTNDISRMRDGAEGRLETLLDELIVEAPDALLVVASLIPLRGNNQIEVFNAEVPGMVEARADAGAHMIFVDQFTDFADNELGDGVHPNQAGYERMAGVWFEAIQPYLR